MSFDLKRICSTSLPSKKRKKKISVLLCSEATNMEMKFPLDRSKFSSVISESVCKKTIRLPVVSTLKGNKRIQNRKTMYFPTDQLGKSVRR